MVEMLAFVSPADAHLRVKICSVQPAACTVWSIYTDGVQKLELLELDCNAAVRLWSQLCRHLVHPHHISCSASQGYSLGIQSVAVAVAMTWQDKFYEQKPLTLL